MILNFLFSLTSRHSTDLPQIDGLLWESKVDPVFPVSDLSNANLYGKNRLLQEKGTPADDLLRRDKKLIFLLSNNFKTLMLLLRSFCPNLWANAFYKITTFTVAL